MGIAGAAYATIIAQMFSGIGLCIYCIVKVPQFRFKEGIFILIKNIENDYKQLGTIKYSTINYEFWYFTYSGTSK